MVEEILAELSASPRDDLDKAEKAVVRLYRNLRLKQPVVHRADTVKDAAMLAESMHVAGRDEGAEVSDRYGTAARRFSRALSDLEERMGIEGRRWPDLPYVPPLLQASDLEQFDAMRSIRRDALDPAALHRNMINQLIDGEEFWSALSYGVVPFLPDWPSILLPLEDLVHAEAARRIFTGKISRLRQRFLNALMDVAKDVYWAFLCDWYAVIVPPPCRSAFDERGRPHCDNGPALVLASGREVFALHGSWVLREAVLAPDELRIRDIEIEEALGTRARMIERYGLERYLRDAGAILLHSDEYGELWWKAQHMGEPLVAVRVRNSTPEPDGTFQKYLLRVPPHVCTAREAVAWTFGMTAQEYKPKVET